MCSSFHLFFVQEIQECLKSHKLLSEHRRNALFKKWNESVFIPLQRELCTVMNGDEYHSFRSKKEELFTHYLMLMKKDYVVPETEKLVHLSAKVKFFQI